MKKFEQIIENNCRVLGVPAPTLRIESAAFFSTETTRAVLVADEGALNDAAIVLNQRYVDLLRRDEEQAVLTLSHECRHLWQLKHEKIGGYRTSENLSVDEYNGQALEVDAWAWSSIAISFFFDKTPDFVKTFGEVLAKKIMDRAAEIVEKKIV